MYISLHKKENGITQTQLQKEVHLPLKNVKNGKAADVDGILQEFIKKNLDTNSKHWLTRFFLSMANKGSLPKAWCKAKITLNKDLEVLQNYFNKSNFNLNANKTTAVTFHLNNREANRVLELKSVKPILQMKNVLGILESKSIKRLLLYNT
ncbi:Reverse transcriptase domain-containing protein [Aphis craccivora]|uniref:Reverse transcriptase domain-containing protein n=1 Tax=Aphis craccivora TaxID=307492 RepID=A0A6G0YHY7_APHCR|nr:Reverse transcriptase domain-containing protein [Aphis craccivora]